MNLVDKILLETDYYIDLSKAKQTFVFTFPENKELNLNFLSVFYSVKPYGLLIADYTKRRIRCPDYTIKSILFTDFFIQCKKRDIPTDIIFSNSKKISVGNISICNNEKEEKLLDIIINSLDQGSQEITDDIREGYDCFVDFISEKIC